MNNDIGSTYWDILEPAWNVQPYDWDDDPEIFLSWFKGLTEPQRVLFPTHLLMAEVLNGGFHQYFTNSTGLHAPEAISGLRKIGLDDLAALVEEAVLIFWKTVPPGTGGTERIFRFVSGRNEGRMGPVFPSR